MTSSADSEEFENEGPAWNWLQGHAPDFVLDYVDHVQNRKFVLSAEEVTALSEWAAEAEKPDGVSGWGPKFSAAFEVAKRILKSSR